MCVRVSMYVCARACVCVRACVRACGRAGVHACLYVCMYVCIWHNIGVNICSWKSGKVLMKMRDTPSSTLLHPPPPFSTPHLSFLAVFVVFSVLFLQVAILVYRFCSRSTHRRGNVKSFETKEITCLEWPRVPRMASCA